MHPADVAPPAPHPWSARLAAECQALRGHRLPWIAVAFGTGVGLYFALPAEPGSAAAVVAALACLLLFAVAWGLRGSVGFVPLMVAVSVTGMLAAQMRTNLVAGPVLGFRYYGAVEGRVVDIDRSASGAPRLTLDRVRLDGLGPDETPRRVRVSLHDEAGAVPRPGLRVMTTAHLTAPPGPTEPGGFDFQRHAWFLKLGGIGYSRVPLLLAEPPSNGISLAVARLRAAIGNGLRERLPGQVGQVAAAITTGDRAGLSDQVTEDLRASNLAHLLAISGLHMGLLVGFVFWAVRGGLALIPSLALYHPTRAWAAAAALPFALAYLFLSGGGVATQRAFVMAVVMLGAVLLGRRALSLRSVAIAALLVLLWRPESLTGPGFQMSFAATAALVIAFGALARTDRPAWMRGWRGAVISLLLSSVVAGLATGPIAALHFNRVGQYGVLANMLAVPMMGFAVMPLLFIGLMLWPFGLEDLPFRVAGWGIEWILAVAHRVAELPGSTGHLPAPTWQVLPLLGLGLAIFGAARGNLSRGTGVVLVAVAGLIWMQGSRPDILISDDGRLVGTMGPSGRWLSREKGASFVAGVWLENDGDGADQATAAARPRPDMTETGIVLHQARSKGDVPAALQACSLDPGWVVLPVPMEPGQQTIADGCIILDVKSLSRTGAVSLSRLADGAVLFRTARQMQGERPWSMGQGD
ncbi:ComEC/Rec2 family competence protein [Jannaschia rubra]|uniref:ComEC family competence protein n=1 Tax=Jannaschia rubra TaxID=282197 RepID=A0A0M6XP76_9RHOB|nr:ComEC/Rec2 family competence protein [Jannaschia rubra]CTQ32976.1 ComEC family competence protein [Jannaschia rubra]SFG59696.1 competence protein ComEC [Jannaschia rubra]